MRKKLKKWREISSAAAAILVFVSALFVDASPVAATILMVLALIAGQASGWDNEKGTHTMLGGSSEFPNINSQ